MERAPESWTEVTEQWERKRNSPWPEENAIPEKGNRSQSSLIILAGPMGMGKETGSQTQAVALRLNMCCRNPPSVNTEMQTKNDLGC